MTTALEKASQRENSLQEQRNGQRNLSKSTKPNRKQALRRTKDKQREKQNRKRQNGNTKARREEAEIAEIDTQRKKHANKALWKKIPTTITIGTEYRKTNKNKETQIINEENPEEENK